MSGRTQDFVVEPVDRDIQFRHRAGQVLDGRDFRRETVHRALVDRQVVRVQPDRQIVTGRDRRQCRDVIKMGVGQQHGTRRQPGRVDDIDDTFGVVRRVDNIRLAIVVADDAAVGEKRAQAEDV